MAAVARPWRLVVGVDAQDFQTDARRFIERYETTYPHVYDGRGSTLGRYGVTGFPETYFVDKSGRARRRARTGARYRRAARPQHRARARVERMRRIALILVIALAEVGAAAASEEHPTLAELEDELVCPTCKTTLAMSDAPVAERMRAFVRRASQPVTRKARSRTSSSRNSVRAFSPRRRPGASTSSRWLVPIAGGLRGSRRGRFRTALEPLPRRRPAAGLSVDGRRPSTPSWNGGGRGARPLRGARRPIVTGWLTKWKARSRSRSRRGCSPS